MSAISLTEFTAKIKVDTNLQSAIEAKIQHLPTDINDNSFININHVVKSMIEAGEEQGYQFKLSEIEVLTQEIAKKSELINMFNNGDFKSINDQTLNLFPL